MIEFQQAGFINFLRTIFWILLIYYAFKLIMRYLAPFILKKAVDKMQQKAQQFDNTQEDTVREGETVIDKKPNTISKNSKTVGEYIDYEEVD